MSVNLYLDTSKKRPNTVGLVNLCIYQNNERIKISTKVYPKDWDEKSKLPVNEIQKMQLIQIHIQATKLVEGVNVSGSNKSLITEQLKNIIEGNDFSFPQQETSNTNIIGIYKLFNEVGKVVYVGQSINVLGRIGRHVQEKTKTFSSYKVIECEVSELNVIERVVIDLYKPIFNKR